jgi:hypothetical protein
MADTLAKTQYLEFIDATPVGRKTKIVWVYSVNHGDILGEVRWYGAWRQYCFYPRPNTIWNTACLLDVRVFIAALHEARRAS